LSLTGNLEDLPLLDILQIVSFSKKTGYLTIRASQGEGAIVFQEGFVVSSFSWDSPPLDPRIHTLPREKKGRIIRTRIETALEQLIRLREGQFSFSLTDEPPRTVGSRDIVGETLERGLNAQELLLDLARGMDEDRRDSTAALEASFATPVEQPFEGGSVEGVASPSDGLASGAPSRDATIAVPVVPPPPAPAPATGKAAQGRPAAEEGRALLLVDDEDDVRRILAEHFTRAGYNVVEAGDPDSAVKKANRLGKAGIEFLLVTDLGMPTSGGASFHGGFEVVKRLVKMNMRPPVLLMAESMSGSLQARAKQMGITAFVFKPGLSKLDPEQFEADMRAFGRKLVEDVLPGLKRAPAPPRDDRSAAVVSAAAPETAEELSRQFSMLQRRLEELRRPGDATQISLLVMKVAREFFERGILFLVKNEEVRGLGGFGPAPKDENITLLVREIVIPLSEPSVFLDVVSRRKPYAGPLPDGKWGRYLVGKIGRFRSAAVALLPLLTHRETIALLFGDNPETGRDMGRLDALELFINQAGIALENALLQRKLQVQPARE
jgi:CheY-like chemotaxis protein